MRYSEPMRTTLTIDDDILDRAKAIADHENRSVGAVMSDLVRKALEQPRPGLDTRNGFPLLPRRGAVVTLEMVNAARDGED